MTKMEFLVSETAAESAFNFVDKIAAYSPISWGGPWLSFFAVGVVALLILIGIVARVKRRNNRRKSPMRSNWNSPFAVSKEVSFEDRMDELFSRACSS
jgi:hypothetical protein